MRRLPLLVVVLVTLVGLELVGRSEGATAPGATPAGVDGGFEGIVYEPLAIGVTDTSILSMFRLALDVGGNVPIDAIDATDAAMALLYVESGTLSGQVEGAVLVTRAEAMAAVALAENDVLPETQEVAAGSGFQVDAGDSVLYPVFAGGEIRNDGSEPVVILVTLVELGPDQATPQA